MDVFYEASYRVSAGAAGLYYQCRPSGVLEMLQEAATQAACEIHISGPEIMERCHAIWMVARMWYRLERPLMWDEQVTGRTWHRADRGAALYRDFDLLVDGVAVGEAVSTWVLADVESRRLLRMSRLAGIEDTWGGTLCKEKTLSKLRMPEEMALVERRRFHYSDTDSNGHVNNVRYADAIADAARLEERLKGHFVSELQVGYLKECRAGEVLDLSAAWQGERCFVHGADCGGVGRFDGMLALSPLEKC